MKIVLSSVYFGNIQYYSKLVSENRVVIDCLENYCKQTYRNRCDIVGANGVLNLTVPVIKVHNTKTVMKDIQIDYAMNWQNQHLRSIVSAYTNSPYFEYYFDDIEPIFRRKEKYLLDLNNLIMEKCCSIIGLNSNVEFSSQYVDNAEGVFNDFRDLISPKNRIDDSSYLDIEYYQVFSEKMKFKTNMSILDLIFCEGVEAKEILIKSKI